MATFDTKSRYDERSTLSRTTHRKINNLKDAIIKSKILDVNAINSLEQIAAQNMSEAKLTKPPATMSEVQWDYYMNRGFKMVHLTNMITLLTDASVFLESLEKIHWYYDRQRREGSDDCSRNLTSNTSDFNGFFISVKLLLQTRASSTIHNSIICLLAKFTFFSEKNFGNTVFVELIGYLTNQFSSFISASIKIALETVIIPRCCSEDIDEDEHVKDMSKRKKLGLDDADLFEPEVIALDKRILARLHYFLLLVSDNVNGSELSPAFNNEIFLRSCIRSSLGEEALKRKENVKNRVMLLRFLSFIARDKIIAAALISYGLHNLVATAFDELSKSKELICSFSFTNITLCGSCVIHDLMGLLAAADPVISAFFFQACGVGIQQRVYNHIVSLFDFCEKYASSKPLSFFGGVAEKLLQRLDPGAETAFLNTPHLPSIIELSANLIMNNAEESKRFFFTQLEGNENLVKVAVFLRCLYYCTFVNHPTIYLVGLNAIPLIKLAIQAPLLAKLRNVVYANFDGGNIIEGARHLMFMYQQSKSEVNVESATHTELQDSLIKRNYFAKRIYASMQLIAWYNTDPITRPRLITAQRDPFVLKTMEHAENAMKSIVMRVEKETGFNADDALINLGCCQILETNKTSEFSPTEIQILLVHLKLMSLLPPEKFNPYVYNTLASLWYTAFKISIASFEEFDMETSAPLEKPWLYALEFRRDYYEKFFQQCILQFRILCDTVAIHTVHKRSYEQAILKLLALTAEYPQTRHLLIEPSPGSTAVVRDCYPIGNFITAALQVQNFECTVEYPDLNGNIVFLNDRNFYPEQAFPAAVFNFSNNLLNQLSGPQRFRVLHYLCNSLMGQSSKHKMNELRYLVKILEANKVPNEMKLHTFLSENWLEVNFCETNSDLQATESEMWSYNPFVAAPTSVPPQFGVLPCTWAVEEADCVSHRSNRDLQYEDKIERANLIEHLAGIHVACWRSVYQGTRSDISFSERSSMWKGWFDTLVAQDVALFSMALTNPWEDEYVINPSQKYYALVGDSVEDSDKNEGAIDEINHKLEEARERKNLMSYTLSHQPWLDSELQELKEIEKRIAKNSTYESAQLRVVATKQRQFAQNMNVWQEVYVNLPNKKGPCKLFFLRAEREIVGFVIGGPSLTSNFDEEVIEIYALHVLPSYAHFMHAYLLLLRAFSMWAHFVVWKVNNEICRYKTGIFLAYEHHPAVARLFSIHPIFSKIEDHPNLEDLKDSGCEHVCYQWTLSLVRRSEIFETTGSDLNKNAYTFLEQGGLGELQSLLEDLTEEFPPFPNVEEIFDTFIASDISNFCTAIWDTSESLVFPSQPLNEVNGVYDEILDNYWLLLTESYLKPIEYSLIPESFTRQLMQPRPNSYSDYLVSEASKAFGAKFSYVNFNNLTPIQTGHRKRNKDYNDSDVSLLAVILRIYYALLQHGQRSTVEETTNHLLVVDSIIPLLKTCASINYGFNTNQNQLYGIPFKLCSIMELLVHHTTYSIESTISHLELLDIFVATIHSMMKTILQVADAFEDKEGVSIVRSTHPCQKCTESAAEPFETNPNCIPFALRVKFKSSACTCIYCALKYCISLLVEISKELQNTNLFHAVGLDTPASQQHEFAADVDNYLIANFLCRREVIRYVFGRPGLMATLLACQKLDADLSSALFPLDALDPVLVINNQNTEAKLDTYTTPTSHITTNKHASYVQNLSTSLRIRSSICNLWGVYLRAFPEDIYSQFRTYAFSLYGPEGDRILSLKNSYFEQLIEEINTVPIATRIAFERHQSLQLQEAMIMRDREAKRLEGLAVAKLAEEDPLDEDSVYSANSAPQQYILQAYRQRYGSELYDTDLLPSLPVQEQILSLSIVEQAVEGYFSSYFVKRLLICTNYAYYISNNDNFSMEWLLNSQYNHNHHLQQLAARLQYRRKIARERVTGVGRDKGESISNDIGAFIKNELYVENKTLPLSKDEIISEQLRNYVNNHCQRYAYNRVFHIVRPLHGQGIIIQRYPGNVHSGISTRFDDSIYYSKNSVELDVFWLPHVNQVDQILSVFSQNCHQWDPTLRDPPLWEFYKPFPLAVSYDHFTRSCITRLLKRAGQEDLTPIYYTTMGIQIRSNDNEIEQGLRNRINLVWMQKPNEQSNDDEKPSFNQDLVFLHEMFHRWGKTVSNYFVEPNQILHFSIDDIRFVRPIAGGNHDSSTDTTWLASNLKRGAYVRLLLLNDTIICDFPDENSEEYVSRLMGRILTAVYSR